MTKKRMGDAWMPAADYGRAMPKFSLNLLVRAVERSLPFCKEILGATVRYADQDFAALNLQGVDFMLHSYHTYDHHPLSSPGCSVLLDSNQKRYNMRGSAQLI